MDDAKELASRIKEIIDDFSVNAVTQNKKIYSTVFKALAENVELLFEMSMSEDLEDFMDCFKEAVYCINDQHLKSDTEPE
jgi:hypothetical protein